MRRGIHAIFMRSNKHEHRIEDQGKTGPKYLPGFKLELRHTSLSKSEMRKHAYLQEKNKSLPKKNMPKRKG